jgi:Ca2+-binding RTX toxin-like protein
VDYGGAFEAPDVGIHASLKERAVKWGQSGSDRLFGIENIIGTVAADRFEGNARNNVLTGSRGNDLYLVTRGGGKDVILDQDPTMGNVDTILFGPGIRREHLRAHTAGDDVVVEVLGDGGEVDTVVRIERGTDTAFTIERFELDDGKTLKWWDLAAPTAESSPVARRAGTAGRRCRDGRCAVVAFPAR